MSSKKRLGEILLEAKRIDHVQLQAALGHQRRWGGKLGSTLVSLGFLKEQEIAEVLAAQLQLPCEDPSNLRVTDEILQLLPKELARRHTIFPKEFANGVLTLLIADPTDLAVIDEVQFVTGHRVKPALALESGIKKLILQHYEGHVSSEEILVEQMDLSQTPPAELGAYTFQPGFGVTEQDWAQAVLDPPAGSKRDALVELLIDKGVITREEWEAKRRDLGI
jgi:type IV pilus assembly protein PilB